MATITPPTTEEHRRAEVLRARYTALTEANPGFFYDLHMRDCEGDRDDTQSVTAALVAGETRGDDLAHLLADDATYHQWRLRLDHPHWWIGTRAHSLVPLLDRLHADLTGSDYVGIGIPGSGYPGAHWFNRAQDAIRPLSQPARTELARPVAQELTGRTLCLQRVNTDTGLAMLLTAFPEHADTPTSDNDKLKTLVQAVAVTHGTDWEKAALTMMTELDPVTWNGLICALEVEAAHLAGNCETAP